MIKLSPKAVFFDLDQTLLDRTKTFNTYLKKAYHELQLGNRGFSENRFVEEIHKWDDNGYRDKREAFDLVFNSLSLSGYSEKMLEHFNQYYGLDAQLFPNVLPFLESLSEKYPLALISNGRHEGQMTKLKMTRIASYFQAILISESQGLNKPDPRIYMNACGQMSVIPEEVVFVGDHPQNDVEQPKALGMKAIWIRNDVYSPPEKYDAIVDSVVEINEYF